MTTPEDERRQSVLVHFVEALADQICVAAEAFEGDTLRKRIEMICGYHLEQAYLHGLAQGVDDATLARMLRDQIERLSLTVDRLREVISRSQRKK